MPPHRPPGRGTAQNAAQTPVPMTPPCPAPPPPGCHAELAARERAGIDYRIVCRPVAGARLLVLAPHAGRIERGCSGLARAIAGEEASLYLFEGLRETLNFERLHLPSSVFDEPQALAMAAGAERVLTVHGCEGRDDARVLLGGLDRPRVARLAAALEAAGIPAETEGHRFPGRHPQNICNRAPAGLGLQLEFTGPLREGPKEATAVAAIRAALAAEGLLGPAPRLSR